ncbi:MAG: hypothetical protein ABI625_25590 [bacterium]
MIVADVIDASSFECSPMRMHKYSGYCVGSSRREFANTTSAAAAMIIDLAAASSATHAADYSAAPSPMAGDSPKTQRALDSSAASLGARDTSANVHFARNPSVAMFTCSEAFPLERSKRAPAVKNLLSIRMSRSN